MMEFFRGSRRKIGIVTLLMACLFAAVQDEVRISVGYLPLFFNSSNGTLTYWQLQQLDTVRAYSFAFEWLTDPEIRGRKFSFSKFVTPKKGKAWSPSGVFVPRAEMMQMAMLVNWTATYWSITIPLTLISIWLLLTKPRHSTQKKTSEPTANEGT